ncbi:hypothetical protein B0H14DRAFT_2595488 [Mycena olivaceomarginata]|nr:hypothetical protein B0H14DRAFT_2595488 [Mycena olivaceomarginata]
MPFSNWIQVRAALDRVVPNVEEFEMVGDLHPDDSLGAIVDSTSLNDIERAKVWAVHDWRCDGQRLAERKLQQPMLYHSGINGLGRQDLPRKLENCQVGAMRVEGFVGGLSEGFWFLRLLDLIVQVTGEVTAQWLPQENDFRPIATQASTKSKLKGCNELGLMRGESFRDIRFWVVNFQPKISGPAYALWWQLRRRVANSLERNVTMIDALAADRARIVDFDAQIQDLEQSRALPFRVAKSTSGRSTATRFLQVPG